MRYASSRHFFMLLIFSCLKLSAQQFEEDIDFELLLASIVDEAAEDINPDDIYDYYYQRYRQKIDLNKAGFEQLSSLMFLSISSINAILEYKNTYGDFSNTLELQVLEISPKELQLLRHFVTIKVTTPGIKEQFSNAQNRYILNRASITFPVARGFNTNAQGFRPYQGSPLRLLTRIRISEPQGLSFNLNAQKHAGEQIIWDPQTNRYGFNFYSAHLAIKPQYKVVDQIILGDFQMQQGQGLVFGGGFFIGKGAETVNTTFRGSSGIIPYGSVIPTGFFRGIGIKLKHQNWQVNLLASAKNEDASIQADTSTQTTTFSTIRAHGYHRTLNEIAGKATLPHHTLGAALAYASRGQQFKIEYASAFSSFQFPRENIRRRYNQFEFEGKHNFIHSLSGHARFQNSILFTELAQSQSGGIGLIGGLLLNVSSRSAVSMIYRKYDPNFHSFYGRSFGEGTRNINEEGFYLGLKTDISKSIKYAAFVDQFYFPWLRYRVDAASTSGMEMLQRISYKPSKTLLTFVQWRLKTREINDHIHPNLYSTTPENRQSIWWMGEKKFSESLTLRSRVLWSFYNLNDPQKGTAIAQDVSYKTRRWKWDTRLAIFNTDDFNTRLYIYEQDVLYAFSWPPYYGKGLRYYVLCRYKVLPELSIWTRFAQTTYFDRQTIGSGNDATVGNKRSEIKLQAMYSF